MFTAPCEKRCMAGAPPNRLAALDALRGIAAILVVLFHYTSHGNRVLPAAHPVAHGVWWGYYGVHLFFAISGFVILMTLERTACTADFVVSRVSRLYPAYWLAVVLTTSGVTVLGAGQLAQPPAIVAVNLTMLQGFLYLPAVDGAYWSLTVELAFYACMLLLWRLGWLGRIERVLIGWIALKLLWWLVPALPSRLGIVLVQQYIPFFALGMCAFRVRQGARRWPEQLPVAAIGLAVVALCDGPRDAVVYLGLAGLLVLIGTRCGRWLEQPLLLWLGAVSYPLYLTHEYLGYALIARLEALGASPALALAAAFPAALALAQCIHACVEQPALAMLRGWWRRARSPRPEPA